MTEIINFLKAHDQLILAASSLFVSIVAIWISVYQIRLGNKHQLFERRLKMYVILVKMRATAANTFNNYSALFFDNPDLENIGIHEIEELLFSLTGTMASEGIGFFRPHSTVYDVKLDEGIKFAHYISEKYIEPGKEIEILWFNADGKRVSNFVLQYGELIVSLADFKRLLLTKQMELKTRNLPQRVKESLEDSKEQETIVDCLLDFYAAYDDMEKHDSLNKLKKTLRLSRR